MNEDIRTPIDSLRRGQYGRPRRSDRHSSFSFLVMALLPLMCPAADLKPFGIEKREFWTTSRVIGSPGPTAPYLTEPAFPKLQFDHAVDLVSAPGSDRLFLAEH